MAWKVLVYIDGDINDDTSTVFNNIADAVIYAFDLADTLGKIAPFATGHKVNIMRDSGDLELSVAVIEGGLTAASD